MNVLSMLLTAAGSVAVLYVTGKAIGRSTRLISNSGIIKPDKKHWERFRAADGKYYYWPRDHERSSRYNDMP